MKFPKNERVATNLLSAEDELEYVITQSLTDPPKFTLYKIEGDKPTKITTGKDPLELQEIWREEKPARKRKES
ncbi:MAG: hypothetical protein J6S14_15390 [Clostridia bacterium]|nr:hypothetical protein [Clostridia bacterium]